MAASYPAAAVAGLWRARAPGEDRDMLRDPDPHARRAAGAADGPPPSAPPLDPPSPHARLSAIVAFVVVTGILHFGRDVLIPLALSVLLAFLLTPAVRNAERLGLNRPIASTVVAALALAVVTAVLWLTTTQLLSLAASLPEYRQNIRAKVGALRATSDSGFGKVVSALKEIGAEASGKDGSGKDGAGENTGYGGTGDRGTTATGRSGPESAATAAGETGRETGRETGSETGSETDVGAGDAARGRDRDAPRSGARLERDDRPVPVTIEDRPLGPLELLRDFTSPLVGPLSTGAAVILFTFVMLLKREDLRDRLIRLVGYADLNRTTQVMEQAGDRVSRYLRMQLVVNVSYGIPVGIALYLLGVPNAALWGLLATVLRFIPYIGPWIAAAFPVALAFAISDGWTLVLWIVGVFVVLELLSNNVLEPWLYGSSTGLSVLAILVAAVFWTWLWGVPGLLLSTPLTVCLFVLGRYVPGLSFLEVMLGDEPVLSPLDRFYQRLLAMDTEEVTDLADDCMTAHGRDGLYAELLVPALQLAERDRHRRMLTDERSRWIHDTVRRLIESVAVAEPGEEASKGVGARAVDDSPEICVLCAHDTADELVGTMLVDTLHAAGMRTRLLGASLLTSERVEQATALAPTHLCISALPPGAVLQSGALCRRLRARLPEARIVVALWHAEGDVGRATQRLLAAGATTVVTTINAAINALASATPPGHGPAPPTEQAPKP